MLGLWPLLLVSEIFNNPYLWCQGDFYTTFISKPIRSRGPSSPLGSGPGPFNKRPRPMYTDYLATSLDYFLPCPILGLSHSLFLGVLCTSITFSRPSLQAPAELLSTSYHPASSAVGEFSQLTLKEFLCSLQASPPAQRILGRFTSPAFLYNCLGLLIAGLPCFLQGGSCLPSGHLSFLDPAIALSLKKSQRSVLLNQTPTEPGSALLASPARPDTFCMCSRSGLIEPKSEL